jgi:LacI family transcriptional regulator
MFGETEDSVEKQSAFVARVVEHDVAGLVVIPATGTRAEDLERFARHIPIVLASRALEGSVLDQVNIEYESGITAAVEHLVAEGHRGIGWIGGGLDMSTSRRGFLAYRTALRRAGIDFRASWSYRCAPTRQNGERAVQHLRERAPDLTAILCFSDLLASGAMAAMRKLKLSPGRDMSIIGFDDIEEAAYMAPPLTTVRIDLALLGEAAARLLVNRIADPLLPRQKASIAVQLVIRETTGSPPQGPNPTNTEG